MSGRLEPLGAAGGAAGVVATVGAPGAGAVGTVAGSGATPAAGAGMFVGTGGASAVGGSAWGVAGRWAPAGTGAVELDGIAGGTMGVATSAGGIGVVVGNGSCGRAPCVSGGGMTATPDGMEGSEDGSSNFGGSCGDGLCCSDGGFTSGGKSGLGCERKSCWAAAGATRARTSAIAARRTAARLTSASPAPAKAGARLFGTDGRCVRPCRPAREWRPRDRSATSRRYRADGRPS